MTAGDSAQKLLMCWLSIAERHSSSECAWRGMKWISYLFPPPSFALRFLAGLLCSSYVSHHYRANPSMTMFNFLWGIWSAVGTICNPVAHLSSINDNAHIPQSWRFVWKEKLISPEWFDLGWSAWRCDIISYYRHIFWYKGDQEGEKNL